MYLDEIATSIQNKNSSLAHFIRKLSDDKDQYEVLLEYLRSQSIVIISEDNTLVKILKDDQIKQKGKGCSISKKETSILQMRKWL